MPHIDEEQTILNQLTHFNDLDYDKIDSIHKKATKIIDSAWHFSWHWDCNKHTGWLTPLGWQQALKDGIDLRDSLQRHVDSLNELIPQIKNIVKRDELRQRLDKIYEEGEQSELCNTNYSQQRS